ncbi:isoprenylcysteine carboxylmethyltransferase family protein [Rhizobium herbae]|uniref:Isoprenylcysteine carboxylmethyltransferase family protein n=1 Tax=Rhizobium herbae TaxID=508661 RepID=A0ABS7H7F5_9HYPH|nr:isoprenylcysteine carboxylmethyltransferase family protein [Rhizobium herbae]
MSNVSLSTVQLTRINILRSLAFLYFGGVCISQSSWPSDGLAHTILASAGLVATFVAIFGRIWSTLYVGGRKSVTLVMDGPYSMTRNPLYFFSLVGIAGIGAQTGSILALLIFVTTALVVFTATVAQEEKFLQERFGAVFQDYVASTPRLLPRPSLWRDTDELEIKPRNFLRTLRDGSIFLVPWPVFELIEAGQGNGVLPVLVRLPF